MKSLSLGIEDGNLNYSLARTQKYEHQIRLEISVTRNISTEALRRASEC